MRKQITKGRLFITALVVAGMATLGLVPAASAHTGEWAKFNNCPTTNPNVFKCLQAVVGKGEVVLGKKKVPVVNPVTLQGGFSAPTLNPETFEFSSNFYGATNGVTLSKNPQPVPGGLSGLINCKEISSWLVRIGCETVFENGLTGLNATLELAQPATNIKISETNLILEEGTVLEMPLKVHLENPLLGDSCYIGSSTAPLKWKLTAGETEPPAGTAPITGSGGEPELKEENLILQVNGASLVDNAWSAPVANGCGGPIVELILDPIVNSSIGLPTAAGKNVAILNNTISESQASVVSEH
jgi:hypothetical protein